MTEPLARSPAEHEARTTIGPPVVLSAVHVPARPVPLSGLAFGPAGRPAAGPAVAATLAPPKLVIRRKSDVRLHDQLGRGARGPDKLVGGDLKKDLIRWAFLRETGKRGPGPDDDLKKIMDGIRAYDGMGPGAPAKHLVALQAVMADLARYVPADLDSWEAFEADHLSRLKKSVRQEMEIVQEQVARLEKVTADDEAPYELMTQEGELWKQPDWDHSAPRLGLSGGKYFAALSGENLGQMRAETSGIRDEWVEQVRSRVMAALGDAVVNHYTTAERAQKMLRSGSMKAKTVLERDESTYRHNTSAYDDFGLGNAGFVFFFIELPDAPFRDSRFGKGGADETGPPVRISLPIAKSGLLASGWIMLSDFAQREYPTIATKPDAPADASSHLPTKERRSPAHSVQQREFTQGLVPLEAEEMESLHVKVGDPMRRQAISTVRGQARGDKQSTMTYAGADRYADRLHQNILKGADIIPGLAERTVVEIARLSRGNPQLGARLKAMSGPDLLKFLLKDLLRPQAMVPNSVRIEESDIKPKE